MLIVLKTSKTISYQQLNVLNQYLCYTHSILSEPVWINLLNYLSIYLIIWQGDYQLC